MVGGRYGSSSTVLLLSPMDEKRGNTHGRLAVRSLTQNAHANKHLNFAFEAFYANFSGIGFVLRDQKLFVKFFQQPRSLWGFCISHLRKVRTTCDHLHDKSVCVCA